MHAMERHASHTVTLLGGSSKVCQYGERRGDVLRGVERIAVEKTGMASHTALSRERGSEVCKAHNRPVRAWLRGECSGNDGFYTLPHSWGRSRIHRESSGKRVEIKVREFIGMARNAYVRTATEVPGMETSLSFGREAFGADWRGDDRLSQDRRANITGRNAGSFRGSEWRGTPSSAQARIAPATSRA